jgi:hypothetical protein
MRVYGNKNYATVGTSGETGRWEMFVGLNKRCEWQFYSGTGRTGQCSPDLFFVGTTATVGTTYGYDPATGIAWIDGMTQATSTTTRAAGQGYGNSGFTGDITNLYFDIIVSDGP